MELALGLSSLAFVLLTAWMIACLAGPSGRIDAILSAFVSGAALVVLCAYVLSLPSLLGKSWAWAAALGAVSIAVGVAGFLAKGAQGFPKCLRPVSGGISPLAEAKGWDRMRKSIALMLLSTLIVTGAINLMLVAEASPSNWDCLAYHLSRVAYYWQHGNLDFFEANYWAQVVHSKVASALMVFALMAGGVRENWTQAVQFGSYWASVAAVYGCVKLLGGDRFAALLGAALFGLLTECLMEAATSQSDLVLCAFASCFAFFILSYRAERRRKYLVFASVSLALMLGTKTSALLALPALFIVTLYAFFPALRENGRKASADMLAGAVAAAVAVAFITLPSGYWSNYREFGNPIGDEESRKSHSFEGTPAAEHLIAGSLNLGRYALEFLSLDGLPTVGPVNKAQELLRAAPVALMRENAEEWTGRAVRQSFKLDKQAIAHEDKSYWGLLGFALILPLAVLALMGLVRSPGTQTLALASASFFMMQAFSGPYDPWRGRYFMVMAALLAPVAALAAASLMKKGWFKYYLFGVLALGALSALSASFLRYGRPVFSLKLGSRESVSVFKQDRLTLMSVNNPEALSTLRRFEELVPVDASLALALPPNALDYPLFGEKLGRRLLPMNSFRRKLQAIPEDAQYLLLTPLVMAPEKGDIDLGGGYYGNLFLRKLR